MAINNKKLSWSSPHKLRFCPQLITIKVLRWIYRLPNVSYFLWGGEGGQFVRVSLEAGNLNIKINTKIADKCALYIKTVFIKKQLQISKLINASCGTVALYGLFIKKKFLADSIKNLRNSYQEYVAPFNSNYHNKTLCESESCG